MTKIFDSTKDPAEKLSVTFDFTKVLGTNVISGTPVAVCTVWAGTDAAPSAVLDGPAVVAGPIVSQPVKGGLANVDYYVTMKAIDNAARELVLAGVLAVRPA